MGYDLNDLYDLNKHSVVLFKYDGNYELIYHLVDGATYKLLRPQHPKIAELYRMLGLCSNIRHENEQERLEAAAQALADEFDIQLPTPSYDEQYTIKRIIQKLDKPNIAGFKSTAQIIDKYNKSVYIVFENGLKFPVKPSGRIDTLPVIPYEQIPPLDYYKTTSPSTRVNKYW